MEFCNLSERGGKCLQGKVYSALVLWLLCLAVTLVCISCVNKQGMSEGMKSWSVYNTKTERERARQWLSGMEFFRMAKRCSHTTCVSNHIQLRGEALDIVDTIPQLSTRKLFHRQSKISKIDEIIL